MADRMPGALARRQSFEGPWLDRLFPIRLPSGRTCSVVAFSVLPTNYGILEGGLTRRLNAQQREWVLGIAKQRYGDPIVVVEPTIEPFDGPCRPDDPRERYPWMACMAHLTSERLARDSVTAVSSDLTLVWWQDAFKAPLPEEIERAATGVEWEKSARDIDFW